MTRIAFVLAAALLLATLPAQAGRTLHAETGARDFAELDLLVLLQSPPVEVVEDFDQVDLKHLLSGRSTDLLHDFEALDLKQLLRTAPQKDAARDFSQLDINDML